ncbi:MAG: hypothetical protein AAFO87_15880 [Cyanobacteria bacterium J06607_6]
MNKPIKPKHVSPLVGEVVKLKVSDQSGFAFEEIDDCFFSGDNRNSAFSNGMEFALPLTG